MPDRPGSARDVGNTAARIRPREAALQVGKPERTGQFAGSGTGAGPPGPAHENAGPDRPAGRVSGRESRGGSGREETAGMFLSVFPVMVRNLAGSGTDEDRPGRRRATAGPGTRPAGGRRAGRLSAAGLFRYSCGVMRYVIGPVVRNGPVFRSFQRFRPSARHQARRLLAQWAGPIPFSTGAT